VLVKAPANLQANRELTARKSGYLFLPMGIAISPRGDMPSIASSFLSEGRRVSAYPDKRARLSSFPAAPFLLEVRTRADFTPAFYGWRRHVGEPYLGDPQIRKEK
jgi:hypothetical protein